MNFVTGAYRNILTPNHCMQMCKYASSYILQYVEYTWSTQPLDEGFFIYRLILSFKKIFGSKLTIMSFDGIVFYRILFL